MNEADEQIMDQGLAALFDQAQTPGEEEGTAQSAEATQFANSVMEKVNRQYRYNIMRRVGLGLLVVLIAIPVQDLALALAPLFVMQLVDVPNQLVADLLAPINSVGSVVSLVLLGVRLTQKKLMDRLAVT